MSVKWYNTLEKRQQSTKEALLWRERKELASPQKTHVEVAGSILTNFSSNDYLGLAGLSELSSHACREIQQWGIGSGASHLVCGHQASALTSKQDLILQDKLNHASLIDGARLSEAQFKRYAHANIEHAQTLLNKAEFENALLMTDGVFSMDGNVAPLDELKQLADQQEALLLVDDAHGLACLGNNGRGSLELFDIVPTGNVLLMGTLGKAVGSFGAFVAGDKIFIEQLIQSARSYIYTTALPPAVAGTSNASIEYIIQNGDRLRESLFANIDHFKKGVEKIGLKLMPSNSAIQPLVLANEQQALSFSQQLQQRGFLVSAIRPPTVPKGSSRLRFTFSAAHRQSDIDSLLQAMADVFIKQGAGNDN